MTSEANCKRFLSPNEGILLFLSVNSNRRFYLFSPWLNQIQYQTISAQSIQIREQIRQTAEEGRRIQLPQPA